MSVSNTKSPFISPVNIRALVIGLAFTAFRFSAQAQSIPVENFSFELPDLGHDTSTSERFSTTAPPAWFSTGSGGTAIGVDDPVDAMYPGSNDPVLPGTGEGAQFGYLNLPAGFSNNFLYNGFSLGSFVSGQTYTLTVAVGSRADGLPPAQYSISLLAGGTMVGAGASGTGIQGTFFDLSYSFTATPAEAGLPIGIQLFVSNSSGSFEQGNLDNVRLSIVEVPEPSSLALVALAGGACLLGRRRYRR